MKISHQMHIQAAMKSYGKGIVRKPETVKPVAPAMDKVEISSMARDIQVARTALSKVPDMRTDKVEEIKSLMASGRYKPSSEDIVDKLMSRPRIR